MGTKHTTKKYELIKLSKPGWSKIFDTQEERVDELRKHICNWCYDGDDSDPEWAWATPNIGRGCRDLGTLLNTACGCEFDTATIWRKND